MRLLASCPFVHLQNVHGRGTGWGRPGGDAQCQRHAVDVHVAQVAGLPALEHTSGVPDHGVAIPGEPLRVKGRSSQSALTMPKLVFAREQAVTEDRVDVAKEEGNLMKCSRS
jgi:hypothetical protein